MALLENVIIIIEHAAEAADCTAHILRTGKGRAEFCISPHNEDAGWSGDLRLRWTPDTVVLTLEHSGPLGRCTVDNDRAGWAELVAWLERELAE